MKVKSYAAWHSSRIVYLKYVTTTTLLNAFGCNFGTARYTSKYQNTWSQVTFSLYRSPIDEIVDQVRVTLYYKICIRPRHYIQIMRMITSFIIKQGKDTLSLPTQGYKVKPESNTLLWTTYMSFIYWPMKLLSQVEKFWWKWFLSWISCL